MIFCILFHINSKYSKYLLNCLYIHTCVWVIPYYGISNFMVCLSLSQIINWPTRFRSINHVRLPRRFQFSIINRFDYFYRNIVRVSGLPARSQTLMPFGRVPSVLSAHCSLRAGGVDRCWVASLSCHAGSARSRTSLSLLCERARISRNAPGTLWGSNGGAIRRPQVFVMNLRGTTSERAEIHTRYVRWEREHLCSLALPRIKSVISDFVS